MTNQDRTPGLGSARSENPPDEFKQVLEKLRDYRETARQQAAQRLGEFRNPEAVPALLARLENDKSPLVRGSAIEALYQIGDKRAWPKIGELLFCDKEKNEAVRVTAAKVLGLSGEKSQAFRLVAALSDSSSKVQQQAAISLGQVNNNEVVPELISKLPTPGTYGSNYKVFADALVNMGGEEVANDVMLSASAYKDKTGGYIRDEATGKFKPWIVANGKEENFYHVRADILRRLGRMIVYFDQEPSVQILSIHALAKWHHGGFEKSVAYLCRFASESLEPVIRWLALDALPKQSMGEVVNTLLGILETDSDWIVRLKAVEILGNIKANDARALLQIKATSGSENEKVRYASISSLGLIGDALALPTLGQIIWDEPNTQARVLSAQAMGQIGSSEAHKYLLSALGSDRELQVRKATAQAITNIDSEVILDDLVDLLQREENVDVKILIVQAIANIDSEVILDDLVDLLQREENVDAKILVAQAAAKFGSKEAISYLISKLSDYSYSQKAESALAGSGPRVMDSLIADLQNPRIDIGKRVHIARVLGQTKSSKAGDALLSIIAGGGFFFPLRSNDNNESLWVAAIEALAQLNHIPSQKRLQQIAEDDKESSNVKWTAQESLRKIESQNQR